VLFALTAILVAGYRLFYPPPPDLTNDGYVSASFDFREYDESLPAMKASTSDPTVVRAMLDVIASGRNDVNCRCINLVTVTLSRPDGKQLAFLLMPAHSQRDCQVSFEADRYAVDRRKFLSAVAPLGIPAQRWTGP
jgi:hypothetical protein